MVSLVAMSMKVSSIHSVVDLCQALVQIPSENPSGSAATYGEEAIAQFVGEFLESLGALVVRSPFRYCDRGGDDRGSFSGQASGQTIVRTRKL